LFVGDGFPPLGSSNVHRIDLRAGDGRTGWILNEADDRTATDLGHQDRRPHDQYERHDSAGNHQIPLQQLHQNLTPH